jgi:hypothetical protein
MALTAVLLEADATGVTSPLLPWEPPSAQELRIGHAEVSNELHGRQLERPQGLVDADSTNLPGHVQCVVIQQ